MAEVFFFIAGIGAIAGAIGVVTVRNSFYAVLSLVGHLLSLAALFLLLRAEFVAAAQVIVYAGAVMVLYVFVVSYVSDGGYRSAPGAVTGGARALAYLFAFVLMIELMVAFLGNGLEAVSSEGAPYEAGFGSPGAIGELLLTKFLFPFEAASFLLLMAAVGAVVLARRRGGAVSGSERPQISVMDLIRDERAGTMAEAVHAGPAVGATTQTVDEQGALAADNREAGW